MEKTKNKFVVKKFGSLIQIFIDQNSKMTLAKIHDSNGLIFTAKTFCADCDIYNREFGIQLAIKKVFEQVYSYKIYQMTCTLNALREELKDIQRIQLLKKSQFTS